MKGSKRKLDEAAEYEMSAYHNNIQDDVSFDFESILEEICKDKVLASKILGAMDEISTGELPTDLVMAAYTANVFAHSVYEQEMDENIEDDIYDSSVFYDIKSSLLEYIFQNNIWGGGEYSSYGIGEDYYGNDVAYFDVPGFGQVSFHLPQTEHEGVREYEYGWKGIKNEKFPSYSRIDNFHDLQMALWGEVRDIFDGIEIEIPEEPLDYEEDEIEADDNLESDYYDDEHDEYDEYDDDYDEEEDYNKYVIGTVDLSDYTDEQEINMMYTQGESIIPVNSLYYLRNKKYPTIYCMTIQNGEVQKIRQLSRSETIDILKEDISQHTDILYSRRCSIEDIKFAVDLGIVSYDDILSDIGIERPDNNAFEEQNHDDIINWIEKERNKNKSVGPGMDMNDYNIS